MNPGYSSGEKFTAVLSTFVVLGILAGALTADPQPPAADNRLARLESDLRFQLELAYKHDRSDLELRLGELDDVLQAWSQSPQSTSDAARLGQWFQQAIASSMPGDAGALPPTPKFGEPDPGPAAVVHQSAVIAESAAATANTASTVSKSKPRRTADPPGDTAETRPMLRPEITRTAPLPATATKTAPGAKRTTDASAAVPATTAPRALTTTRPIASAPADGESSIQAHQPKPSEEPNARVVRKIATADATLPPPANGAPGRAAVSQQKQPTAVQVNLSELDARIRGYHRGLDRLEAGLAFERGDLSIRRLSALVDEVEQLSAQYDFVSLYYGVLSDRERVAVPRPRPVAAVVADVQRALQQTDGDKDFLAPFAAGQPDPRADLSSRLQTIIDADR